MRNLKARALRSPLRIALTVFVPELYSLQTLIYGPFGPCSTGFPTPKPSHPVPQIALFNRKQLPCGLALNPLRGLTDP